MIERASFLSFRCCLRYRTIVALPQFGKTRDAISTSSPLASTRCFFSCRLGKKSVFPFLNLSLMSCFFPSPRDGASDSPFRPMVSLEPMLPMSKFSCFYRVSLSFSVPATSRSRGLPLPQDQTVVCLVFVFRAAPFLLLLPGILHNLLDTLCCADGTFSFPPASPCPPPALRGMCLSFTLELFFEATAPQGFSVAAGFRSWGAFPFWLIT